MKIIRIILTAVTLGVLLIALMLSFGKVTDIEFESPGCGKTTLYIVHGRIEGMGYSMPGNGSENLDNIVRSKNDDINYITANITRKGYSNSEVVDKIGAYIESVGGKITKVTEGNYVFSGLDWVYERLSRA
jgi:hypothetical protein